MLATEDLKIYYIGNQPLSLYYIILTKGFTAQEGFSDYKVVPWSQKRSVLDKNVKMTKQFTLFCRGGIIPIAVMYIGHQPLPLH